MTRETTPTHTNLHNGDIVYFVAHADPQDPMNKKTHPEVEKATVMTATLGSIPRQHPYVRVWNGPDGKPVEHSSGEPHALDELFTANEVKTVICNQSLDLGKAAVEGDIDIDELLRHPTVLPSLDLPVALSCAVIERGSPDYSAVAAIRTVAT